MTAAMLRLFHLNPDAGLGGANVAEAN